MATAKGVESAVKVALSVAGLSWEEQGELLESHPEILRTIN